MVKKWIFLFLILETLSVTYLLRLPAFITVTTLLYTFSGIAISLLLLFLPEKRLEIKLLSKSFKKGGAYQIIFLFLGGLFIYKYTQYWISQSPLSYKDADMIPIMQVMAQRFLDGNWSLVYSPIQEIWNGIQPIYLPAMWMPFLVSEKFSFDPRWITSFAVFLSFFLFIALWRAHWKMRSGLILLFVSGILCVWLYTDTTHNFIRLSEEGIVVFYYSLLALVLLTDNFLMIGFVTALCTLSRYILVGWLPVILLYLLVIRKQKKDTLYFIISFSATILFLVILPFGYTPLQISFFQPEQYIEHAARIWKESPAYFTQSMGFAKFFGPEMIEVQHRILVIVSFLVPLTAILLIIYYAKQTAKKFNNIGIATLKLTVVIVYTFIDVPYQYLFFTSSFISLIAITGVTSKCEEKKMAWRK
ncbi:MAG: hypothetical protein HYU70_17035 [Bacteroidetes bacterium]|nr:hypothetical protein [Bacteroidota bacterium]